MTAAASLQVRARSAVPACRCFRPNRSGNRASAKCSPPARRNVSRPRMPSSSSVSRQSAEKPGAATAMRFTPLLRISRRASRRSRAPAISPGRSATGTRHRLRAPSALAEQPRRFLAVAMIRIAELQRPLRHAVEAQQQALGLEVERIQLPRQVRAQRVDVERIVVIRRQRAQRRLPAHRGERREHRIVRRRRRGRAILRIERRGEDARAAFARPCSRLPRRCPGCRSASRNGR